MALDLGTLVAHLGLDSDALTAGLRDSEQQVQQSTGRMGKIAKVGGAALGAALAGGVVAAVNLEPVKKKLVAQLALTPEEQQRINASAEGLFKGNYGEDLGQVNDAIKSVIQNIDGMRSASTEDLQAITGQALSLADTFEQDVGGVAVAVGQMLKTGMAGSAQEALDILAAGFQAGNDKAEDLLDTMNEYGTQFRKAGIDGKTAMGLIQQGLQGGARDADIVADAIKEMSIRLQDGSALEGLNELGLNGNEIIAQFREGGPQAAAAMDQLIDKIRDTDAVTQNLAAVQKVAGTQVEDLGAAFNSLDLSSAAQQLGDVAGKSQEVDKAVGSTVSGSLESLKRTGITALSDLGEVALPVLAAVVGAAGDLVGGVTDLVGWFDNLPAPIKAVALALGALALARALGLVDALATGLVRARSQMALMGSTAAGVGGKLKSFGSSALAAVGGPGGLLLIGAIVGVTAAMGSLADASARAKQNAEAQAASVSSLSAALKESNGLLDANVRAAAAANLEAAKIGDRGLSLLDVGREMGLTVAQLTDAQLGNADAIKQVNEAMIAYVGAANRSGDLDRMNGALQYSRALRGQIDLYPEAAAKAKELADNEAAAAQVAKDASDTAAESKREQAAATREAEAASRLGGEAHREEAAAARDGAVDLEGYSAAVAAAATATRDGATADEYAAESKAHAAANAEELAGRQETLNEAYERAQSAADAAGESLSTFEQQSKDSADAQSELADQAQRVSDELDRQSGRAISLEEANARAAQTGDDLAETFKQGAEGALRLSDAMIQSDGSINTSDETGRKFREGVLDTRDAMVDQATAAFDAAGGYDNLTAATAAAEKASQTTYDQFLQTATGAGLTRQAAVDLAKEYGLFPPDVTTAIKADDQATAKVAAVRAAADAYAQQQYEASISLNTSSFDAKLAAVKLRASQLGRELTLVGGPAQLHAAGGAIVGPGTGTSDSIAAWLSNGEHVIPADEVDAAGGQPAIYRLRQVLRSGNMPKFRDGGGVGVNVAGLSGIDSRSLGSNEGLVVGALADLVDAVKDLADVEADATDAAREARSDWRSAVDEFRQTRNKGAGDVADARADRSKDIRAAQVKLTEAQNKLTEAQKAGAKTAAERARREKAIGDATKGVAAAETALSRARTQGNETVRRAGIEAGKANAAAQKKIDVERRQYQAAERARKAAEAAASEAQDDLRRTVKARQVLTALGRAADGATKNLQDARSRLDDLKGDRQGLISSIAGTLNGYNGGILGNNEQRRTGADVLRGLTFQAGKVEDFGADLAALKKNGLSAALLQQIADAGVDGGALTADALANSTPAMLAKINAAAARTNTAAVKAGTTVGDAVYAKQIAAQTVQYRQMARQLQEINTNQRNLAAEIGDQFDKIVGSIGADDLALLVKRGSELLRRRGVKI